MHPIKAVNTQIFIGDKITSNNEIGSFRNSRQKGNIDLENAINDKIERIKKALADYVKSTQRNLEIQVHKPTGDIIVRIVSKEDGKIIREIPSEKLLNLAAKLEEISSTLQIEHLILHEII